MGHVCAREAGGGFSYGEAAVEGLQLRKPARMQRRASSVTLRSNLTSRTPYFPLSKKGSWQYLPTP